MAMLNFESFKFSQWIITKVSHCPQYSNFIVTLEMGANGECEPNQGAKHVHMEMPQ
jgi:hypothetical protein